MTDMTGIINIAKTLMCIIHEYTINTMLPVLFATEASYTIKENNKEKIILARQVTILPT